MNMVNLQLTKLLHYIFEIKFMQFNIFILILQLILKFYYIILCLTNFISQFKYLLHLLNFYSLVHFDFTSSLAYLYQQLVHFILLLIDLIVGIRKLFP